MAEKEKAEKDKQAMVQQPIATAQTETIKRYDSEERHTSTGNSHPQNSSDQEKSSKVSDDFNRLTTSDEDNRIQRTETTKQDIGERTQGPVLESEYRYFQPNEKMRLGNTHTTKYFLDVGNNTGLQENNSQGTSYPIDENDAAPIPQPNTISAQLVHQETQSGMVQDETHQKNIVKDIQTVHLLLNNVENNIQMINGKQTDHASRQHQVYKEDVRNPNMPSTKETHKRLESLFKNEQGMKGRLRTLDVENIRDILYCCDNRIAGSGGFGEIYISKSDIPGLDMRVVLKKIECSNDENDKMRSTTNEKLASRTMHYGIVPLLAMGCDSDKKTYYFLTPYLENGDLFHAIEKDNMKIQKKEEVILDVNTRLRILFQITSAIDFLHTPVKNFRGAVLHMDIKTLNIVLDKCNNARLIDFGLAREMKEGCQNVQTTRKLLPGTQGYFKTILHGMLTKHEDYCNLGVVIRELLTGVKPFIEGEKELKEWTENKIERQLLSIWKMQTKDDEIQPENDEKKAPLKVAKDLIGLSTKCLKEKKLTSTDILREIETWIQTRNIRCWQRPIENASATDSKCEICMEHQAVRYEMIQHDLNCRGKIDVCVSCMLHSYCNPLRCHSCDKVLTPTIGHGWAALLIAGNDTKNTKAAKGFRKDITDVHETITSKFPLVMGVRKEHVAIVCPEEPGKAEKYKRENGQLDKASKFLEELNNIQTLLIYFSGHHYDNDGFQLGSAEEFLSLEELLTKVSPCLSGGENDSSAFPLSNKRLIAIFDCCSAPGIQSFEKKSGLSILQLNACRPNQTTYEDAENGSKFTLFFKQGLTGRALGKQCFNVLEGKVKQCHDCKLPGDFVTLQDLNTYISHHLQVYKLNYHTVTSNDNASDLDVKIGYAVQCSVVLHFTFKLDNDEKRNNSIPQRMFTDMISLRTILSDKFVEVMQPGSREEPTLETEVFRDILCIEIEHGPKKVHRDELDSLERVMGAWYAKRDLIVSMRRLSDIRNGKVGMFLPTGFSAKPIIEYLGQNKYFEELGPNSEEDTVYSVKLENLTKISVRRDKPHLEKIRNILADLEDEFSQENDYKELRIIFPGAHGKQRNDFICFQLVK